VGVLMLLGRALDDLGARFRTFWNRAGSVAIAVYAWHLTALSLCVGIVAIPDVPAPRRLSLAWVLMRPLWIALVVAVCGVLVALTGWVRTWLAKRARPLPVAPLRRLTAGTVAAAAGGAYVGLRGPATVPRALVCCALLGAGWLLLRTGEPAPA
jgi:hypothetical protein